jgi:predicted lipoprotein with Yx(FWY)xxD motif
MHIRSLLLGVAALTAISLPAFAEDYVGGAIKTMDIGGKMVITNDAGMTLYTFDKDEPGVSNCYDECAVNWPPAIAADGAVAEGEFTLVERTDGTKMWAYEGMPLYLWKNDTKPGDTTGDMVGEVWHTAIVD